MGLCGPLWGMAFVPYCGHENTAALSTAKGHGLRSSRGSPTLTVASLHGVSSRWLKAVGIPRGRNRGWTLPAAPWRGLPLWRLLRAAQGSRGVGGLEGGSGCGGGLGPGDSLARASCPLAGGHSPAPGALHAGLGPLCTPAHPRALLSLTPQLRKQRRPLVCRPRILGGGSCRGPSRERSLWPSLMATPSCLIQGGPRPEAPVDPLVEPWPLMVPSTGGQTAGRQVF